MSDHTLRPIWTPADYEETLAEAAKHRAIPGAYVEQAALYAEAAEHAGRHRAVIADGPPRRMDEFTLERGEPMFGTAAHEALLGADEGRPLPYRRNPETECLMCWAPAGRPCDPYCIALLSAADQLAHRDAVLDATIAEVDRLGLPADDMAADVPPWADGRHLDDGAYAELSCTIAGRHRVRADPWRRVRRLRAVIAVAVVVLVLALGALWAASHAKAESFDLCPSGRTGVASADTSCAFAENVRTSFYWNPQWTIVTTSPVTGKFYTMQCHRTDTSGTGWYDSKRCWGVNDAGAVLVVFIA
ncbi:hypothetical protein Jolie2_34 [Mycobacterium phage Jolie2]|uniref:Uncharacterized protein n=1 Tax=Mycobacterium phage Jolie2 TaxID=1458831 RepID=W8E9F6_9CAUD|nr:hypothetical protein Jolie2_34 [Mycobacterium phage Jolie2]AHJ86584.1 hypothetical protein Jolie2_34 [Mycobacterium phage Jolie2]